MSLDLLVRTDEQGIESDLPKRFAIVLANLVNDHRRERHEERIHAELELQPVRDHAAVFPAAPGNHAIPRAIRPSVLITQRDEFTPPIVPVDTSLLLYIPACVAHTLRIEDDTRPRVRRQAPTAVCDHPSAVIHNCGWFGCHCDGLIHTFLWSPPHTRTSTPAYLRYRFALRMLDSVQ